MNGPPLLVGDQVEYHVLLFNAAAVTATEVWIEDYIPANTGYVPGSATTTNGTISGPDPLRVDAAEQLPLEMLFFRFRVTVDPVSFITSITHTATAAISGQAPVEAQAIIGPVGGDDVGLVIGKIVTDVNGPPLYEGDVLEYTIGLANTDDVTHTHVVVTDAVPYGTSYVEGSAEPPQASGPDPLLWTVEDLPAKEIVFFTFRVTVDEGMAGQSYAIQTGDLAGGADTILQLYASDCLVLLAENDDYEDNFWSRIEWTATETASHYLRVRNYDPTIGGEGVSYSIGVQQTP